MVMLTRRRATQNGNQENFPLRANSIKDNSHQRLILLQLKPLWTPLGETDNEWIVHGFTKRTIWRRF
jgi:hypothetical protein